MKAILIFNKVEVIGGIYPQYELTTKVVEVGNQAEAMAEADKLKTSKVYIHYDGMLLEYTTKPVLIEVGTGIEL